MKMQNWEIKREALVEQFKNKLKENPGLKDQRMKFSWSNWAFGTESLETTAKRLSKNDIEWIELHGNRYGKDLGYKSREVLETLGNYNMKVSGVCGIFSPQNDLSSNSGMIRQNALDYIRRHLELCQEVGATYFLIVPTAVGRPGALDDCEMKRASETLRIVADEFAQANVLAAVEPINSTEVSLVHTVEEAKRFIDAVNHSAIANINGDTYHMQLGEANIAESIIDAGDMLVNLHLADSTRCGLGGGSMDLDAVIMALYVIEHCEGRRFVTPEPLGASGDPYPLMFGTPDVAVADELVASSVSYWRERENELIAEYA